MKPSRASQTSSMVAMFRAAADEGLTHVQGFRDPTAKHLLDGVWLKRLERARRNLLLREAMKHGADLLALRTMVIDAAVKEGLARGARQLVILGAGLDGRAHRLEGLAEVSVFEVDHPATQALKRERAAGLAHVSKRLTYVPVDFERDALEAALQGAGHRADQPTVWIWEGVVMYLTDEALRSTLRIIAGRSQAGSTLVIQYNRPVPRPWVMNLVLRFWGEPMIGLRSPAELARELSAAGFTVGQDTSNAEWAVQYRAPAPRSERGARIVTAMR
jgi:methyltransferase (TIGR00027 family)